MSRERRRQGEPLPPPIDVPESLQQYLPGGMLPQQYTWEDVTRQSFDMMMLPDESFAYFRSLRGQKSSLLDQIIKEASAYHTLNSAELVVAYFQTELLDDDDPYNLIDIRIGMPGSGIRGLYDRLIEMVELPGITEDERAHVLEVLGYWEEAAIQVITDPILYFTKTRSGSEGTISEFFGSSIAFDVSMKKSPNLLDGRYRDQLLTAVDVEGLCTGKYSEYSRESYRQGILIYFLHAFQGQDRLPEEFWLELAASKELLFSIHSVVAAEGFPSVTELFLQALEYEASKENEIRWTIDLLIQHHFKGRTALDQFIAAYASHPGHELHPNISEKINTPEQQIDISEDCVNTVVFLGYEGDDAIVTLRYAHITDTYQESLMILDRATGTLISGDPDLTAQLYGMLNQQISFEQEYLRILNEV